MPGDALLPDAAGQPTHGITIGACPEQIWPWLLQLGCERGGYYAYDLLDNGGVRSARQIRPELQSLAIGQVLPASPKSKDDFQVLAIEPERALILGGLWDAQRSRPTSAFTRPRSARCTRSWSALSSATSRRARRRRSRPTTGAMCSQASVESASSVWRRARKHRRITDAATPPATAMSTVAPTILVTMNLHSSVRSKSVQIQTQIHRIRTSSIFTPWVTTTYRTSVSAR